MGDVRDRLRDLPDESVHCVVTSPPYWGLRDYGVDGQIGLEDSPDEFIQELVRVFREVRRVLRADGTLWLNLGDSYVSNSPGSTGFSSSKLTNPSRQDALWKGRRKPRASGLKVKDLVGVPWRVALALQEDGWYLRSEIIWHKPACMPESVQDRPTRDHEHVFLLTKSPAYYYDATAIREPVTGNAHSRGKASTPKANLNAQGSRQNSSFQASTSHAFVADRNKRTVWTVPSEPFHEAHFATFPTALVEPCVKAGTSEHGACATCGSPWTRVTTKTRTHESGSGKSGHPIRGKGPAPGRKPGSERFDVRAGPVIHTETLGWEASCNCPDEAHPVPCVVLDPFAGAGTTLLVAAQLGRDFVGVELNPEYAEIARKRVAKYVTTLRAFTTAAGGDDAGVEA